MLSEARITQRKLKTTKIIVRGPFKEVTKIASPENYRLHGIPLVGIFYNHAVRLLMYSLPAVLDVSFHSQDLNSPNTMVIFEGQPMSLNCGSYTSIPTITLDWSIAFGLVTTQIDPSVDFVIQGLDGRLYFQNPKANVNNEIYVCQALNPLTAMAKRGYIDTTVLNGT